MSRGNKSWLQCPRLAAGVGRQLPLLAAVTATALLALHVPWEDQSAGAGVLYCGENGDHPLRGWKATKETLKMAVVPSLKVAR
jgi:hypothetical protein